MGRMSCKCTYLCMRCYSKMLFLISILLLFIRLHFKLERWMDYGPTIAAAFAARQEEMIQSDYYKNNKNDRDDEDGGMNTTNDVSALRKIILGCMRNARDAALLASQERTSSPRQQPEYQGRYHAENDHGRDHPNEGSPEKFHAASQSSKAGLYHQAFAGKSCISYYGVLILRTCLCRN